jgi:hypothetical protein
MTRLKSRFKPRKYWLEPATESFRAEVSASCKHRSDNKLMKLLLAYNWKDEELERIDRFFRREIKKRD